jgi:hypothetical protein
MNFHVSIIDSGRTFFITKIKTQTRKCASVKRNIVSGHIFGRVYPWKAYQLDKNKKYILTLGLVILRETARKRMKFRGDS